MHAHALDGHDASTPISLDFATPQLFLVPVDTSPPHRARAIRAYACATTYCPTERAATESLNSNMFFSHLKAIYGLARKISSEPLLGTKSPSRKFLYNHFLEVSSENSRKNLGNIFRKNHWTYPPACINRKRGLPPPHSPDLPSRPHPRLARRKIANILPCAASSQTKKRGYRNATGTSVTGDSHSLVGIRV